MRITSVLILTLALSVLAAVVPPSDPGITIQVTDANGQAVAEGATVSGTVQMHVRVEGIMHQHAQLYANMLVLDSGHIGMGSWERTVAVDTTRFFDGENLLSLHVHPHAMPDQPYPIEFRIGTFLIRTDNQHPAPNGDVELPVLSLDRSPTTTRSMLGGEAHIDDDSGANQTVDGLTHLSRPVQIIAHLGTSVLGRFRWAELDPPFAERSLISGASVMPFLGPDPQQARIVFFFTDGVGRANYAFSELELQAASAEEQERFRNPVDVQTLDLDDGDSLVVPESGVFPLRVRISNLRNLSDVYPQMSTWIGNRSVVTTDLKPLLDALLPGQDSCIIEVPLPGAEVAKLLAARPAGAGSTGFALWHDFTQGRSFNLPSSGHIHLNSVRTAEHPWPYGDAQARIDWPVAGYETINGPLAIRYNTQGPVPEGLLGRLLINGEEIARPASLRGEHVVEGLPRGTHELAWRLYAGADLVDEARTTIHVVNDPPRPGVDGFRAFRDQSLTLAADRSVLANDSDHEDDPLSVQLHEAPQHGSLDLASDGSLVYLPAAGFTGLDRFSYEVSDGQAGSVQHATILVSEVHTDGIIGGWTNFGGNAVHTGRLSATLGTRRPVERWRRSYIQLQPVAVDDGRVVVTSGKQDLQVLDPITGAEVWSYAFDRANSLNPPSVADGTIYVQRGNHVTDSQLWAVDLRNGTRRWSSPFTAQWQRYLAPTVTDGRIYVNGGRNGGMYGFDVDGSELFFTALAYDQWTPAYAEGRVYSWAAGKFAEHDATTGAIGRQVDLGWTWSGYSMNTAPVISGGTAYLRGNGVLHAVDLQSFEERWQLTGTFHGTPAADAGQIVAYRDQDLLVLDVNSGAILGQVALGAWGWHQPIVTDDVIFAATAGEVILLDRADLGEIARLPRGGHICLADNALYVASTGTNELICYELRPAPNDPPVAVIASPLDASVHETGSAIGFSGSGEDPEDGSLGSAALSWTSSLDGFLGTGVSLESSALSSGNHVIVLTATDSQGANASAQVTISVVEPDPPPSGDGSISREVWLGVAGNHISSIPLDRAPDISDELTVFETPSNWADGYGTRVRGYLTAPESGSYAFWIASDDEGELWLSSDEDPAGRQLIAQVGGWTSSREWNKYASQRSAAITLSAGQRYYIEALHKEGGGGDNLAIGWLRPGETGSVPSEVIPGALLSPFIASDPEPPVDDGTLPVGYGAVDLGSTLPPGASSHQDGEWTVDGAGADIWGTADGFHFVHRELFGDGSITARVLSQQDTNAWAKAGVMIREQLAADSRHAMMVVTPGNGTAFQYRTGIGSSSTHASGSMVGAPYWVRVVRRGDTLDGYESSDGSSWRLVGSTTLAMDEAVFIGLGVTSHSNGTLSRAVFDQLSVVSSLDADG